MNYARERSGGGFKCLPSPVKQSEQFSLIQNHITIEVCVSAFTSKIDDFKADVHYDVGKGNDETDVNPAIVRPETQTLALGVRYVSGYVSSSSILPLDLSKITLLSDLQYCKNIIGVSKRTRSFVF